MSIPERFSSLPEYAFPRLRRLLADLAPGAPAGSDPIDMTIGEPRHPMPAFVGPVLAENLGGFAKYPPNEGSEPLRQAMADWVARRYGVTLDPDRQIMALNGTREGLFNAALALCPEHKGGQRPVVLIPNPFYQVYAVAALAVGAEPVYLPATRDTGYLPDFDALPPEVLNRTALAYLCSPANPQGAVADAGYWARLIALAERHDFTVLADECYGEIYRSAPPPGALAVAQQTGADPDRVVIFHSLSKRSNLPGLRAGFAAGGAGPLGLMRQLRAYAGAPLPLPVQAVAARAWSEETHVTASRGLYQRKFAIADEIFGDLPGYVPPEGGFFLWLPVAGDEAAARRAWQQAGVRVLPGGYLGRDTGQGNPGAGYVRVAMVAADPEEMRAGLIRLRACLYG